MTSIGGLNKDNADWIRIVICASQILIGHRADYRYELITKHSIAEGLKENVSKEAEIARGIGSVVKRSAARDCK